MPHITRTIDPTPEGQLSYSRCDNCQVGSETKYLNPIHNLEIRIQAGSEVPSGECPDCGALCYLVKPKPTPQLPQPDRFETVTVLEDLLKWAKYMGGFESPEWWAATRLHHKLTGRRIDV